jgi:hypothetical protein
MSKLASNVLIAVAKEGFNARLDQNLELEIYDQRPGRLRDLPLELVNLLLGVADEIERHVAYFDLLDRRKKLREHSDL